MPQQLFEDLPAPFEQIAQQDSQGHSYWSARELANLLGYAGNYRHFIRALARGRLSCQQGGHRVEQHFQPRSIQVTANGKKRRKPDILLSRLGCYLTTMNADGNYPEVARSQAYFIERTIQFEKRTAQAEALRQAVEQSQRLRIPNAEPGKQYPSTALSRKSDDNTRKIFLQTLLAAKIEREDITDPKEIQLLYQEAEHTLDYLFP